MLDKVATSKHTAGTGDSRTRDGVRFFNLDLKKSDGVGDAVLPSQFAAAGSRRGHPSEAPMLHSGRRPLTASDSRITYTLESSLASVDKVEQTATEVATQAGMDEDQLFGISMAVREAAVNAVMHGNGGDAAKQITATFENTGKSLVFTVADQGKGLDPSTLPDPLAPENLLRGSGRGIFLIRSFMDEVHFRQLDPGTELTLIKHLGPASAES